MSADHEVSIEQEVNQIQMQRPHVVLLGAGASRAACLNGDKNGMTLPLMEDLVDIVGLSSLLERLGINPEQNFEEIFSDLYEKKQFRNVKEIQKAVENYFKKLELPEKPTVYDHLILSLREKDLIATFNWDPLLMQAYLRNNKTGLSLPKLVFLHGNISIGYCEKDNIKGLAGALCRKCGKRFVSSPLLYPIRKKNYSKNLFIANEWGVLDWGFKNAFMITIFGYSGPKTDQEAIAAMKNAWGDNTKREMEQTSFITIEDEDQICNNWDAFIHTHHYEVHGNFYDSWISDHPRRTGEAYINQYIEAEFINQNPIPEDLDFSELWKWYAQFKEAEEKSATVL
jgi:hypothetical protein